MSPPGFDTLVQFQRATGTVSRDSEGRATATFANTVELTCAVAMRNFFEVPIGGQHVNQYDAVVLIENGSDVQSGDRCIVPTSRGEVIAGTYRVAELRDVRHHIRAFLQRAEDPVEA